MFQWKNKNFSNWRIAIKRKLSEIRNSRNVSSKYSPFLYSPTTITQRSNSTFLGKFDDRSPTIPSRWTRIEDATYPPRQVSTMLWVLRLLLAALLPHLTSRLGVPTPPRGAIIPHLMSVVRHWWTSLHANRWAPLWTRPPSSTAPPYRHLPPTIITTTPCPSRALVAVGLVKFDDWCRAPESIRPLPNIIDVSAYNIVYRQLINKHIQVFQYQFSQNNIPSGIAPLKNIVIQIPSNKSQWHSRSIPRLNLDIKLF